VAKILIVDDDGDLRTLYGLCFLRRGHSTVVASNGAAALECLTVHSPDLLVTDVNMPVMDGLELLRRVRANGQHDLPVIVLTARSDQRAAVAVAGADAFLVKPAPLRELAEVAELLIEGRRAPHAAS
jgi:two-component system, OmpR family, response regulator